VYDDDGRIIRTIMTKEPEWTEVDRAEVFALALYRSSLLCPCGCGFLRADTFSREGEGPDFTSARQVCRARLTQLETAASVDNPDKPPPLSAQARVWTTTMKGR
jgi:hypothetical protein